MNMFESYVLEQLLKEQKMRSDNESETIMAMDGYEFTGIYERGGEQETKYKSPFLKIIMRSIEVDYYFGVLDPDTKVIIQLQKK